MANGPSRWTVLEVHNFGGFFGGDTVTLTASRWGDGLEETITIDEKALANMSDRYKVAPAMVFDLVMAGERVDRAELVGAADWPLLDAALSDRPVAPALAGPTIRAYRCEACALWIAGEPDREPAGPRCRLCARFLSPAT